MIPLLAASHALIATVLHRATRLGVNQVSAKGRGRSHQRRDAGKTDRRCLTLLAGAELVDSLTSYLRARKSQKPRCATV